MKHFRNTFGLISLSLCLSCASGGFRVESQPEGADVLVSVNGQPARKIGVTPLNVDENNLGAGRDAFQLIISKENFQTQNIVVPSSSVPRNTVVQTRLTQTLVPKQEMMIEQLQKIASGVSDIQTMLRAKQYDEAERSLGVLINQYPSVATLHELLGTAQYLKKDLNRALASYSRASELNPNNPDTKRMVEKIRGLRSTGGN